MSVNSSIVLPRLISMTTSSASTTYRDCRSVCYKTSIESVGNTYACRANTVKVVGIFSVTLFTMTQLRDMENAHNEKVSDIAVVTLEKLMKNELEEDLPDDLRMVSASRHFQ